MERVKLLYGFADVMFNEVKQTLISDVLLRLSQLTDKARMGKKENLSLYRLREVVESMEPGRWRGEALMIYCDSDASVYGGRVCKSIRDMRNRTIAHRDWGRRAEATPVTNKRQKRSDQALDLAAKNNSRHLHLRQT